MAHEKLGVLGPVLVLVRVHGDHPQRGHEERERVQHNVRQADVRLVVFDQENGYEKSEKKWKKSRGSHCFERFN